MLSPFPRLFGSLALCLALSTTARAQDSPDLYTMGSSTSAPTTWDGLDYSGMPWVRNVSSPYHLKSGLAGRHLFVWPSHGRYFDGERWKWQRPILFCTTEDLLSQSFVFPYLIPMLENAGAVVYTPRERDAQTEEAVVDNDHPTSEGQYVERDATGKAWRTADVPGFGLPHRHLTDNDQPFRNGTSRCIATSRRNEPRAEASWTPKLARRGRYAVYVSYTTLPDAVDDAHYTVFHSGGKTEFRVNQRMGGGTWLYLGTFLFEAGENEQARVVLDNASTHKGHVSADAVRFGGGMGIASRSMPQITISPDSIFTYNYPRTGQTSGLSRRLEGARYYAQWAGLPNTLYRHRDETSDYNGDLRARAHLLNYLGGGSPFMPDTLGARVPFELSFALHTDAGFNRNGSIYGTLGLFTGVNEQGDSLYRTGTARRTSLDYARRVMTNLHNDVTRTYGTDWHLRELFDKNYAETRMPEVPSIILELLAHQNFADMKFAHDPNFKFTASRAIYKAMLQYVSAMHGEPQPAIQPLPVNTFSARLVKGQDAVQLSWHSTEDSLETSATPTDYIVYTRTPNTDFDNGRLTGGRTAVTLPVVPGIHYIYKVAALNAGGRSFDSPELSVYCARGHRNATAPEVLVVDAFNRLSGPARIETADSLGFDLSADCGVPRGYTLALIGKQTNFDRQSMGGEGPRSLGHGGSEWLGRRIAGNNFDGSETHTAAIIEAAPHVSVSSTCVDAFNGLSEKQLSAYRLIDYAAGLERDAPHNLRPYKAIPVAARRQLQHFQSNGGHLLVSGSFIGSDLRSEEEQRFLAQTLHLSCPGNVRNDSLSVFTGLNLQLPVYNTPNADHFACNISDVLEPTEGAFSAFAYGNGGYSAGVAHDGQNGRTLTLGFPFECISDAQIRAQAMSAMLQFLLRFPPQSAK